MIELRVDGLKYRLSRLRAGRVWVFDGDRQSGKERKMDVAGNDETNSEYGK
jgi:hypothetical protein